MIITGDIPFVPEERREELYKEALRQSRLHLINAQAIIRPTDERYKLVEEIQGQIEELIMKRS